MKRLASCRADLIELVADGDPDRVEAAGISPTPLGFDLRNPAQSLIALTESKDATTFDRKRRSHINSAA